MYICPESQRPTNTQPLGVRARRVHATCAHRSEVLRSGISSSATRGAVAPWRFVVVARARAPLKCVCVYVWSEYFRCLGARTRARPALLQRAKSNYTLTHTLENIRCMRGTRGGGAHNLL